MTKKTKNKGGRPSPYKKSYAKDVVKYVRENYQEGASFRSFAPLINVSIQTLHKWADEHKEFSDARETCLALEESYWTKLLFQAASGKCPEIQETSMKVDLKNNNGKITQVPQYQFINKRPAKMSVAAITFALKNLFPERWKERQEIDFSNIDESMANMSDEELTEKRKKLEERLSFLRNKHGKSNS